ncbi:cell division ATP-binding protein FtsE [Homoserinibacter sp. GY 40078]|uniref:cell division ATP-binding protein FtsE n=1 Tax=Homoserinibacter sp. GY 40078 TaxID=2603275 RepID=UPI0011CC6457|nr:cell division ATP-binding protein FtsE [Homoserinibacter sp. GY 40078]TXK17181.1 cell division ATP-binding protein FtsE [Homoserinibacter sp. GY 40078]
MIRFDQVTKTYSGTTRPALDGVSLEVLKGEFVFLVGASGSGKSSFLRLILKEERPSKGRIHVLGHDLTTLANRKVPYFRRSLGVVFQDFRLLPGKNVFDNVAFTLQVIGKSKGFIQEAVPDVLKMVGLAGKAQRLPHELSGGEQQRVAIARAIVNKPAILLADEPTGNLDPATSAGIMTLLSTINANGTTVLMATHDSGIVDTMKRRVIELVSGQIVRDERAGGYQTQALPIQDMSAAMEREQLAFSGPPAPDSLRTQVPPPGSRFAPQPSAAPAPSQASPAPQPAAAPERRQSSAPATPVSPMSPPSPASVPPTTSSSPSAPPPLVEPGSR